MGTINKHNCEAFFLDYHEGNLTPQQVADLLLFVEQHPELKAEFENFENLTLEDYSSYTFDGKEGLKRDLNVVNTEEYFIRSVEGTLNKTEEDLLDNYLKQHPQFLTELQLFQKTKLVADTSIVFEEKEKLKRVPETADNLLISAVEGLLSKEENILLTLQLTVDSEMRQEFNLYQRTKLQADNSFVYENKEKLKRKESKVIPFFFYVSAIAAAILLLFGMFLFFNNGNPQEQKLAKITTHQNKSSDPANEIKPIVKEITNTESTDHLTASVIKKEIHKKNSSAVEKRDSIKLIPAIIEQPNNIVQNAPENTKKIIQEQIVPNSSELASSTKFNTHSRAVEAPSNEFSSLGQIAAEKIKEKMLDPEALAIEKKNGRLKKLTGWDVAQILAKGATKITGKKVEAKPTYNEEGEVTAFALGAGAFQISRGR